MSIIAVDVRLNEKVGVTVKKLAKSIKGNFEIMKSQKKLKVKTCFVRLSELLDPVLVVENLNRARFNAYIPKDVPKLPSAPIKKGRLQLRTRLALGIRVDETLTVVIKNAHAAILEELQYKYTKLYSMSQKTKHQLLESIALTILDRMKEILKGPREPKSGSELSMWYRRRHPHFGDLELVLNALHAIQDAAGTPKSQLQENDLIVVSKQPSVMHNLPLDVVQRCCSKYSDRILNKLTEHIKSLDCEVADSASEDEKATAKVRQQIKKMDPYMPEIVRQIISDQFLPKKTPFYRMRMYGEPYLPKKEALIPLMKRNSAVAVLRSDYMYNLLRFNVPARQFSRVMELDSTSVQGMKLIVRSSDMPIYKPRSAAISKQIGEMAGEEPPPEVETKNEEEDEEYMDAEDEEYMDLEDEQEEEQEEGDDE